MTKEMRNIVVIGGCGHVGLPLGMVFADHGTHVVLLDIDGPKVDAINHGKMPFREAGAEALLPKLIGKSLHATTDRECLRRADVVISVIGTPVDEHLNPTVTALYRSLDDLIEYVPEDSLLVLRSTVYPGVTRLLNDRIHERGRKIHLAFCPERIAEGKAIEELTRLPQIISAFEPAALAAARDLFSRIAPMLIELDPLEAELAKLFTNSWRYLNFAASNQFYMLAESYGLDFYRIYDAVIREYPRMRSFARAGLAAGPCLLKDTLQLAAFSGNNFFLGHAAMLINEGLPNFIVNRLRAVGLSRSTVAILGMAFKGDSDDNRSSLSYKLKHLLEVEAREVICTDPFVSDITFVPVEEAVERADVIILGAPHSAYRDLQFPGRKEVVDVWGYWRQNRDNARAEEAEGVQYAGRAGGMLHHQPAGRTTFAGPLPGQHQHHREPPGRSTNPDSRRPPVAERPVGPALDGIGLHSNRKQIQ
jgi:UDP-N-acetyl-D-mannosaminuronic acid dehydrogenase